ncbi:aldo/keto reductase [Nocardia coffeae]|uniref:aldo/keto reductase n=1 Tax=Nocardia coffeae TaxID=2873381 RepID=UPI0027E19D0E|nr:aldo/keto reductase [Nocardia coffeae]
MHGDERPLRHPTVEADMVALMQATAARGFTFFNTAEIYGPFDNEELVGKALAPQTVEGSLRPLRTDRIDLLCQHAWTPRCRPKRWPAPWTASSPTEKVGHFRQPEAYASTTRRAHIG